MASPALPPAAVSSSTFTHRRPQRALVRCSAAQPPALPSAPQRVALAAAAWALTAALGAQPAAAAIEPVYFGNGCFWGRQKDFIDEEAALGRQPGELSAVVGYAAGKEASSNGKVCCLSPVRCQPQAATNHTSQPVEAAVGTADATTRRPPAVLHTLQPKTVAGVLLLHP